MGEKRRATGRDCRPKEGSQPGFFSEMSLNFSNKHHLLIKNISKLTCLDTNFIDDIIKMVVEKQDEKEMNGLETISKEED